MLLHTRVFFPYFGYQILHGFTNDTLAKIYPLFYTSMFRCFFFFNLLIADFEILPIGNSLLMCKCEEKPNIIMTDKNIKYMLQL